MTEEYEGRLNNLLSYTERVGVKIDLFIHLKKKLDADDEDIDLGPVMFGPVLDSLLSDSVVSLAKLFEGDRSDRNLIRFLNFTMSNRSEIDWSQEIGVEEIKDQKESVEDIDGKIKNVMRQRDKYFAHHDKEYFSDSGRLSKDYPASIDDVENLVSTAWDILNDHRFALDRSKRIPRNDFAVAGMEQMFEALRRENRT